MSVVAKESPKKKIPYSEDSNFKVYLDTELSEDLKLEGTARELEKRLTNRNGLRVSPELMEALYREVKRAKQDIIDCAVENGYDEKMHEDLNDEEN